MIFTNVNRTDLEAAATSAHVTLVLGRSLNDKGTRWTATLRPDRATLDPETRNYLWQRISVGYGQNGRRVFAVCWHGHKAFLDALFERRPDAIVRSGLGGRKVVHRGSVDLSTAWIPLGPPINSGYPLACEACDCPFTGTDRSEIASHIELRGLGRVHVRLLPNSAIKACPHYIMVPEHYRADNSCKCNDPNATEMKEWGYVWDGASWTTSEAILERRA